MNARRALGHGLPIGPLLCGLVSSCVLGDFKKGPPFATGGSGNSGGDANSAGRDSMTDAGAGTGPTDVCVGTLCETPPANGCEDAAHLTAYDTVGSCVEGTCSYTSHAIACECVANTCTSDPCAEVSCDMPPASSCVDRYTERTFAASGTCAGGSCDYPPTDTQCLPNYGCTGGRCELCKTTETCGAFCSPCPTETPFCVVDADTSSCFECTGDEHCGIFKCVQGTCVGTPGCGAEAPAALRTSCGDGGASRDASCCAKTTILAGSFNRSNDASAPATLSNFTLDTYEVTVGRFRQFTASFTPTLTPVGSGANPNNPSDDGWQATWGQVMLPDRSTLREALKCDAPNFTWTDEEGPNENRPINCVTWFEAQAFCIWDRGGRLPTETEWNYAAAQGDLQSTYPWGNTAPAANAQRAAYSGYYSGTSVLDGVADIAPVGKITGGYTRFGQADMAGNVEEWVADTWDQYQTPCNDCGPTSVYYTASRVSRGGGWSSPAVDITSAVRSARGPQARSSQFGFRCAGN